MLYSVQRRLLDDVRDQISDAEYIFKPSTQNDFIAKDELKKLTNSLFYLTSGAYSEPCQCQHCEQIRHVSANALSAMFVPICRILWLAEQSTDSAQYSHLKTLLNRLTFLLGYGSNQRPSPQKADLIDRMMKQTECKDSESRSVADTFYIHLVLAKQLSTDESMSKIAERFCEEYEDGKKLFNMHKPVLVKAIIDDNNRYSALNLLTIIIASITISIGFVTGIAFFHVIGIASFVVGIYSAMSGVENNQSLVNPGLKSDAQLVAGLAHHSRFSMTPDPGPASPKQSFGSVATYIAPVMAIGDRNTEANIAETAARVRESEVQPLYPVLDKNTDAQLDSQQSSRRLA